MPLIDTSTSLPRPAGPQPNNIDSVVSEILGSLGGPKSDPNEPTNFKSLFASKHLSAEDGIEILASIARTSTNEAVQMRAVEMMFRLSGELKGDQNAPPISVNITIVDPDVPKDQPLPILLPRELLANGDTDATDRTEKGPDGPEGPDGIRGDIDSIRPPLPSSAAR